MTDKFKCVECGQAEVDDEDDVCEDCWELDDIGDNSEDEE